MKKIIHYIASASLLAALAVVPVGVHAQDTGGVIEVGGGASSPAPAPAPAPTTPLPSAGGSEPAPETPKSGIAPSDNKLVQNSLIFVVGGTLGAGIGLGIVTARKKNLF